MRREPVAVLGAASLGGLLLLAVEPAVGLVCLAGAGAALLLQPPARRATAAVLAAVGLVTAVVSSGSGDWLVAVGGALVAAAGAVAAVRATRWPGPRRGERDRAQARPRGDGRGPGATGRPDRAADTWAALDRGEDPTA